MANWITQQLNLGKRGTIQVDIENKALYPGEKVVGVVHVEITKQIEAAYLTVRLHGKQRLRWVTVAAERSRMHHKRVHDYPAVEAVLVGSDSTFLEGTFHYPFELQVPVDWEPSLAFARPFVSSLRNVQLNVEFALDATLVVDAITIANLVASVRVKIRHRPPQGLRGEPISKHATQDLKLLGMLNSGSGTVTLELPTNVFHTTSKIEALVKIQNDSKRHLKYVVLALHQNATVNRRNNATLYSASQTVRSRRFEAEPLELAIGASDQKNSPTLQLPITAESRHSSEGPLPTLASHFLAIDYRVVVECHFSKSGTIRVGGPVTIARPHDRL